MVKFNVYYEIADSVVERATIFGFTGKYFALLNQNSIEQMPSVHYELARHSERIWQERDGLGIRCIKNRHCDPQIIDVDEKEFMWIKLSSKAVN